ncbi:MAG TPA: hypothetical protein VF529_11960 [Solirubrobacteraceae bacterium]
MSDDQKVAAAIALAVVLGIVAVMFLVARKVRTAKAEITIPGPPAVKIAAGSEVPAGVAPPSDQVTERRRSLLAGVLVGKDNRTSTSKTIAFAWTLVIAFGLMTLLFAKWLGDPTGWDEQLKDGVQSDYLVLLGGPLAAAVLAKMRATSDANGRTPAAPNSANVQQLVTDDEGDTNLSDFQYLLFNLIAIVYFLGQFLSSQMDSGFPDLPDLLSGLIVTSATGYSATKFVATAKPTLTSVVPLNAAVGGTVKLYGQNLVFPALGNQPALPPIVSVGGVQATLSSYAKIMGADVLEVPVPTGAKPGAGTIAVVRADGLAAVGPAGSDGIAFVVADDSSP